MGNAGKAPWDSDSMHSKHSDVSYTVQPSECE